MNIYDMVPGEDYLVGDGLGYDKVRCVTHTFDSKIGMNVVIVKYLETGHQDMFFEAADCGFSTYVEPLNGR
jgi:hypothetical protein